MKGIVFLSGLIGTLVTSSIVLPVAAQVTSDGTTNTTVNTNGNNFTEKGSRQSAVGSRQGGYKDCR